MQPFFPITPCKVALAFLVVILGNYVLPAKDLVDPVQIIDLARSYYGQENLLDSVRTIYYEGQVLEPGEGKVPGNFRMFLKKPMCQRIELQSGDIVDIRSTNGLEGYWMRLDKASGKKQVAVLDSGRLETMIVGALENLNFLKATDHRRRDVWFRELTRYQGAPCYKLRFQYKDVIYYDRLVDAASGRILLTEDNQGLQIHQRGDVFANGIRFPKNLESYQGRKHVNTLLISLVLLNSEIPDSFFDFPDS
jgi:hypothetical protein